jgi:hypothetical protein
VSISRPSMSKRHALTGGNSVGAMANWTVILCCERVSLPAREGLAGLNMNLKRGGSSHRDGARRVPKAGAASHQPVCV